MDPSIYAGYDRSWQACRRGRRPPSKLGPICHYMRLLESPLRRSTFVNNEDLGAEPSRGSLLVLANLGRKVFSALDAKANASERVDGDTTNIASRDT